MHTNKLGPAIRILLVVWLFGLQYQPARSAETAAYTVNSLADSNDGVCNATHCTLREAINAANGSIADDSIQFSLSGTILLGSTLPNIVSTGHGLTIDGSGREIEISGADSFRAFYVGSSASLTLRSLTIRDGDNIEINYGGGIYNDGTLNVDDCTFTGNAARVQGGAIYHHQGTLTITNTRFTANTAGESDGGALYIYKGHVSITNSSFDNNTAGYSGGAIYNRYEGEYMGGDLTIVDTSFNSNLAASGSGGAIANDSNLTIEDSEFLLNTAEDNGGAIDNDTGSLNIDRSTFGLNTSNFGNGGGIYIDNISQHSSIHDSIFSLNSALNDGGGFYVYRGSAGFVRTHFFGNLADRGGGGFNSDGLVYLLDSTFESNNANLHGGGFYNGYNMQVDGSSFFGNDADSDGGGIYHGPDATNVPIENSTFYDNSANRGGGLFLVSPSHITNCTISANRANTAAEGGGLRAGMSTVLKNSILANNTNGGNCNSGGVLPEDAGNNIDSGTTCGFGSTKGSMSSTDPLLGAMVKNGGTTKNMMPGNGSLAVDGVIYNAPNDCPEDDQRGYPRPYGARCDIGAVERYFRVFLPLTISG